MKDYVLFRIDKMEGGKVQEWDPAYEVRLDDQMSAEEVAEAIRTALNWHFYAGDITKLHYHDREKGFAVFTFNDHHRKHFSFRVFGDRLKEESCDNSTKI